MKLIPLTQGKFAVVDDADFDFLNQFKWFAHREKRTWYALRNTPRPRQQNGEPACIRMHREILSVPGFLTDHRDGDGLHNRRENLRVCTLLQNNQSYQKELGATSQFKGVSWHKVGKKWMAQIGTSGTPRHEYLGLFSDESEAARVYDVRARALYGDFAKLNFP